MSFPSMGEIKRTLESAAQTVTTDVGNVVADVVDETPKVAPTVEAVASDISPTLGTDAEAIAKILESPVLKGILARNQELETLLKEARAGSVDPQDASNVGGEPVPHHLHLADGSIVTNHGGNATHYSTPDGRVRKVVAQYASSDAEGTN